MRIKHLISALAWLIVCLCACQQSQPQSEYCTVKGTVKGVRNGTILELQDDYDHFKVIATTRVKGGAFEFHPDVSAPTHVYLYTNHGKQLKDFFLEPGTIVADIDDTDEHDMEVCASGTPANDFCKEIDLLYLNEDYDAVQARWDEIIDAGENGILALHYARNVSNSAVKALDVLDRLSPEMASKPCIAELRDELSRRAKAEPAPAGSGRANFFIDMEYPDADGNPVSLSSVVNDPANRLVLLDFWAVWCDPCREAVPSLKALYAKYHGKGLEIYSVSEDPKEDSWKPFLAENGMTWVNVRDVNAGRKNSQAWSEYALTGIPTTLLIDGTTGEILSRDALRVIEAEIASLLQ